jgi:hypothetical protein
MPKTLNMIFPHLDPFSESWSHLCIQSYYIPIQAVQIMFSYQTNETRKTTDYGSLTYYSVFSIAAACRRLYSPMPVTLMSK